MDDSEESFSIFDIRNKQKQNLWGIRPGHNLSVQNSRMSTGSANFQEDLYNFSHPRRGLAIIISNGFQGQRAGCEHDTKDFEEIFKYFGFEIRPFLNKTAKELLEGLNTISKEDFSNADCLVIAISTHGDQTLAQNCQEDIIYMSDALIKTRDVIGMFTDERCPTLKDKPRLCFIQACRGTKLDDGHDVYVKRMPAEGSGKMSDITVEIANVTHKLKNVTRELDVMDACPEVHQTADEILVVSKPPQAKALSTLNINIKRERKSVQELTAPQNHKEVPAPCSKDFLVMYATPPGFFAFRRPHEGSWFIKCLSKVLLKSNGKTSLTRELTKVINMVSNEYQSVSLQACFNEKKQCPVLYSMLTRDIYLEPRSS